VCSLSEVSYADTTCLHKEVGVGDRFHLLLQEMSVLIEAETVFGGLKVKKIRRHRPKIRANGSESSTTA
jgi:hypothetical protein